MQAELNLASRVPGFEIIKLEKHEVRRPDIGRIEVWLRNDTGKAITAYAVAAGIGEDQPDLLGGDEPKMLPPGGVIRDTYGMQAELETRGVTIMAAIFDDGSTAGDPRSIGWMAENRQGIQIQSNYSIKLFREIAAAPDAEFLENLGRIETRLAALSSEQENALPALVKGGYRYQVDLTRHQLQLQGTLDEAKSIAQLSRPEPGRIAALREQLRGHADRYENLLRYMRPK
jgi:hypothetical protein